MKALIIEDQPQACETLQLMLQEFCPEITFIDTADNGLEGVKKIRENKPDIIFMDIDLPFLNGFEILTMLENDSLRVIFVTASPNYVMQAIKFMPYDYLLKPVNPDDLVEAISRVARKMRDINPKTPVKENASKIILSVQDGKILVSKDEIICIDASASYSEIYFEKSRTLIVSHNLKRLEEMLNSHLFFRCHHSHLLNLRHVIKIKSNDGLMLEMSNGMYIPVSRRKRKELSEALSQAGL